MLDRARRLRVAVIHGGRWESPGAILRRTHNPRPWKSYEAVANDIARALAALGFAHVEVLPEDARLAGRLDALGIDLAWLNTGGVQGQSPMAHAPSVLEMLGVPYVGLSPLNAAVLDAKHTFKTMLLGLGLPTAPFALWTGDANEDRDLGARLPAPHGPFVVKPVAGRASLLVEIAETAADVPRVAAAVAGASGGLALIEPFLAGAEYCISVMGPIVSHGGGLEDRGKPFVFSAVERRLDPGDRIAPSMDRRPISRESYRLLSAPADGETRDALGAIATGVYRRLRLEGIVRLDLRRDSAGHIMVLEANPKPDLKRPGPGVTSLVCAGLCEHGMDYEDLILSILANRLADYAFRAPKAAPHLAALAQ
jgi:D-alanine-D-alanine ligase